MTLLREEPRWLPRLAITAAHADQIRTHGGQPGIRDEGLLDSALARPQQLWHYGEAPDLAAIAAAYGFGIIKNHPFLDGNKRTGFVAANMFLVLNGQEIDAPEPGVVDVITHVAAGSLDEAGFADWIRGTATALT
ncbi:MAG: type II toxin-antitoxin system death-on-curing family toxin [Acidobacteria bacterium]|nr:type II toxin-antitoxin system death-on-curing family toxin [Acidobacteriota bacterium]